MSPEEDGVPACAAARGAGVCAAGVAGRVATGPSAEEPDSAEGATAALAGKDAWAAAGAGAPVAAPVGAAGGGAGTGAPRLTAVAATAGVGTRGTGWGIEADKAEGAGARAERPGEAWGPVGAGAWMTEPAPTFEGLNPGAWRAAWFTVPDPVSAVCGRAAGGEGAWRTGMGNPGGRPGAAGEKTALVGAASRVKGGG